MKKGLLSDFLITQDTDLNLLQITQGKGVIHLSIYNGGTSVLIIDDSTQQEIEPDNVFVVESLIPIVNTSFRLKFKKENGKVNRVFVRYIVETDC